MFVLSVAVVALAPASCLVKTLGATKATALLSTVASLSALAEILLAPLVGALSDSIGRKPVLLLTLAVTLLANALVAIVPAVPLVVAYFPAVQVSHFEQPAWLDPDAKVSEPHGEHARSELRDPAALTKVPPPQTVQGAHELGGRLDSDTVKVPL